MAEDFRIYLQGELAERCKRNPKYSLRSFAKALGVDASTLAKVLNGKRRIGRRSIESLGAKVGLRPAEIRRYTAAPLAESQTVAANDYVQLAEDAFEIIADWQHCAILELITIESFRPDAKWVARSLGISAAEVHAALGRLVRAGMLEITADGRWLDRSGGKTSAVPAPGLTNAAAKEHQRQILALAQQALVETPPEERDQSSMTMAIDRRKLGEARLLIKQFRRELAALLCHTGSRTDVYHLGVSLYPVSKRTPIGEDHLEAH